MKMYSFVSGSGALVGRVMADTMEHAIERYAEKYPGWHYAYVYAEE